MLIRAGEACPLAAYVDRLACQLGNIKFSVDRFAREASNLKFAALEGAPLAITVRNA